MSDSWWRALAKEQGHRWLGVRGYGPLCPLVGEFAPMQAEWGGASGIVSAQHGLILQQVLSNRIHYNEKLCSECWFCDGCRKVRKELHVWRSSKNRGTAHVSPKRGHMHGCVMLGNFKIVPSCLCLIQRLHEKQ